MSKFFSKLKGEKEKRDDLRTDPSSSSASALASNNPYQYTQTQPPAYEPPPGPPPSHISSPKHHETTRSSTQDENPPPYHDWTSVPDTALLPPPPAMVSDHSSTTNATYDEAAAGHAWCARNPVYEPRVPNVQLIENVQAGQHDLDPPQQFRGTLTKLSPSHPSSFTPNSFGAIPTTIFHLSSMPTTTATTAPSNSPKSTFSKFKRTPLSSSQTTNTPPGDQTHLTRLPLYFAATSSPLSPHFSSAKPHPFTIYLEIRPLSFTTPDSTVSLGFAAKPFPSNRQPGWHRASLAVHSDDGNRYVNDGWGGREFTTPFQVGEVLGLAVQVLPEAPDGSVVAAGKKKVLQSEREVRSGLPRCKTRVWLTRNGVVSGSWDVDEERDAERDEGVAGLFGEVDLYGAVGTFGGVEVEVRFYGAGGGCVALPVG